MSLSRGYLLISTLINFSKDACMGILYFSKDACMGKDTSHSVLLGFYKFKWNLIENYMSWEENKEAQN